MDFTINLNALMEITNYDIKTADDLYCQHVELQNIFIEPTTNDFNKIKIYNKYYDINLFPGGVRAIDNLNNHLILIRDSQWVAEVENSLGFTFHYINNNFQQLPYLAFELHNKSEVLANMTIEYLKNRSMILENNEINTLRYTTNLYNIAQDKEAYYHHLCKIDFEPKLFFEPTSLSSSGLSSGSSLANSESTELIRYSGATRKTPRFQ